MKATLITKNPAGRWTGDAALYRMEPPMEGNEFVIASIPSGRFGECETYLFAADETGKCLSWTELPASQTNIKSHKQVLEDAGYQVIE